MGFNPTNIYADSFLRFGHPTTDEIRQLMEHWFASIIAYGRRNPIPYLPARPAHYSSTIILSHRSPAVAVALKGLLYGLMTIIPHDFEADVDLNPNDWLRATVAITWNEVPANNAVTYQLPNLNRYREELTHFIGLCEIRLPETNFHHSLEHRTMGTPPVTTNPPLPGCPMQQYAVLSDHPFLYASWSLVYIFFLNYSI